MEHPSTPSLVRPELVTVGESTIYKTLRYFDCRLSTPTSTEDTRGGWSSPWTPLEVTSLA